MDVAVLTTWLTVASLECGRASVTESGLLFLIINDIHPYYPRTSFSLIYSVLQGGGYEYFFERNSKLEGLNRGLNRPGSFTNTPPTLCGIPYRSGATSSRTNQPTRDSRSTCIMRHESRCVGPYRPCTSRGYLTATHSNTPAKRRAMISYYPYDLLSQSFQVLTFVLPDY